MWQDKEEAYQEAEKQAHEDARLKKLLDISHEGELLTETKEILEELHIISKVYTNHSSVVEEFQAQTIGIAMGSSTLESKETTERKEPKIKQLVRNISRRKAELHDLIRDVERTANQVRYIHLDLT